MNPKIEIYQNNIRCHVMGNPDRIFTTAGFTDQQNVGLRGQ
jgi:hypothetical protein